MLTLLNKNNILAYGITSLFFTGGGYAGQLNINNNATIDLTEAVHIEISPYTHVEHEPHTADYTFPLNATNTSRVAFTTNGTVELFWNNQFLSSAEQNSKWLFIRGGCDTSGKIRVVTKPDNWLVAYEKGDCLADSEPEGLSITFLKIESDANPPPAPATLHPEKTAFDWYSKFPAPTKAMLLTDPSGSVSSSPFDSLLLNPHEVDQKNFLANPQAYEQQRTRVYVLNTPIGKGNQKYYPGGDRLNQVVREAPSADHLLQAIQNAYGQMPGHPRVNLLNQDGDEDEDGGFQQQITGLDGNVNVQKVYNLIKNLFKKQKSGGATPDSGSSALSLAATLISLMPLVPTPVPASEEPTPVPASGEPDPVPEGAVGGIGISTSGASVNAPTDSEFENLVQQLIDINANNVNQLAQSIMELAPEYKAHGFKWLKAKCKKSDGSISTRDVAELLESIEPTRIQQEIEAIKAQPSSFQYKKKSAKKKSKPE